MRTALLFPVLILLGVGLYCVQQQFRFQNVSVRGDAAAATRIWPANAEAWRALSLKLMFTDPTGARAAAQRAIADDREDYSNWAQLGVTDYEWGDTVGARAAMAQMVTRSLGFKANWSYANLLLMTEGPAAFWPQAEKTLALTPPAAIPTVLGTMWQAASGNATTFDAALTPALQRDPALAVEAFSFMLAQGRVDLAAPWWNQALALAPPSTRGDLATAANQYVGILLDNAQPQAAATVWHDGLAHGIFAAADGPSPSNRIAAGDTGPFGWNVCSSCGPLTTYADAVFTFQFQGNESDAIHLAGQMLLLDPATTYRLSFTAGFQSAALTSTAAQPGLHLRILDAKGALLADATASPAQFTTPAAPAVFHLELAYQRPLGQMPLQGTVTLSGLALAPVY